MDEERNSAAADWWARFQEREPTGEEVAAWLTWMEQDEANARAFHSMNELALRIHQTRASVPQRLDTLDRKWRARRSFAAKSLAAVTVLVVAGIIWFVHPSLRFASPGVMSGTDRGAYSTSVGRQRDVLLSDGSHVFLGGASEIDTDFTDSHRHIRLRAGEAYFEVEHDATRPFVVDVGVVRVQALGTNFNIRKNDERVAVTVADGRVRVSRSEGLVADLAVAAGLRADKTVDVAKDEQLVVAGEGRLTVTETQPERATAWRHGRLEFVDEPLDVVLDNVRRYSDNPLVFDAASLHSITYTGAFLPQHADTWLSALSSVFPVRVTQSQGMTHIRSIAPK